MTLTAFNSFHLSMFLDTSISLISALILGGLIGYERQFRQRTAGLRTNVLVAVGASLFVDIAGTLNGHEGSVHVIAYVVSGIGFLGAGSIMREGTGIKGLNTAATLWGSAAVGAACGADLILEAILGTVILLAANTMLRPVASRINRTPIKSEDIEGFNVIHVISPSNLQKKALSHLISLLTTNGVATRDLDVEQFGEDSVEIKAVINASAVSTVNLDKIIKELTNKPYTEQAFWSHELGE